MKIAITFTVLCFGVCACGDGDPSPTGGGDDSEDAPQYAEIGCYPDGSVIAAAARQRPAATIERAGRCFVITGGGDPVNALIGNATCTSAASTVTCTDNATTCFAQGTPFGPPGTPVTVAWTGGEVPADSVQPLVIPSPVTIVPPPTTIARGGNFLLEFSVDGPYEGEVRVSAAAPYAGSTAIIECVFPAGLGEVGITSDVTQLLEPGTTVNANVTNVGLAREPAGDFQVDVLVHGQVNGPQSFSLTVTD